MRSGNCCRTFPRPASAIRARSQSAHRSTSLAYSGSVEIEAIRRAIDRSGRPILRLGGIGEWVAKALQERTGKDARVVVLGHLLRGGSPTSFDRLAALRFGSPGARASGRGLTPW